MKTKEMVSEAVDRAIRAHTRNLPKPCEDFLYSDAKKKIYIVLDGITRVHKEYDETPGQSAACEVNEIFAEAVVEFISANLNDPDAELLLRQAVKYGNDKIRENRKKKSLDEWGFYPGTLGIIALLRDSRMHYICAGDCLGMIIRGNTKICFGEQLPLAALEVMKISKKDRYDIYCNHPENALSYTIFNGDVCVPDTCEYACIDLCAGDVVVLASDGIKNYLKYEFAAVIKNTSAGRLIDLSTRYDEPPFGTYGDDKSLLKFVFAG